MAEVERRAKAVNRSPMVVAVMSGLTAATWYNWTSGRVNPSCENMDRIRSELSRMERHVKV